MFTLDFNAIAEQLRKNKSAIVNNVLAPAVVEELKARHGMDVYGGAIVEENGEILRVLYI